MIIFIVKRSWTYRSVVNNDITAVHVAMENVFLQVLDERALQGQTDRVNGLVQCFYDFVHS